MRYNRFEYTKALEHYRNVFRCVWGIWFSMVSENNDKIDNKVFQEFTDWINLALNENCEIPSTITFKSSKRKKKQITYKIGDFFFSSDAFFSVIESSDSESSLAYFMSPLDFMLTQIKLWCNLDSIDPKLFVDCCHHSDIFGFMKYLTHLPDEDKSQFEKAIFDDQYSPSGEDWNPYLEYSESNYYLNVPLFEIRIKYEDNIEEWYKFAIENICEAGKHKIELELSEEGLGLFYNIAESAKNEKSSKKSK